MDKLEKYAQDKEQDLDELEQLVMDKFIKGTLTKTVIKQALKTSFMLGHNAGHCRGEKHLQTLMEEREELEYYE